MRITTKVSAGLVAILSLAAGTAQAQVNSATINATAIVQAPLNVVGATDLDFGQVLPGVAKAVAVSDATPGTSQAGRFDVTGAADANINLTFTLPVNLVSGGNTLPIGTWTGYHNDANSASVGGASFTPSAAATATTMSSTGTKFVFVGATVSPVTSQAAGTYTGTVQMTVDYF
ncbi:MAG: DUF4402 domain-containing protein [Gemmatimonadales bacterium]